MSTFREKYLKYKEKYLALKNQLGGVCDCGRAECPECRGMATSSQAVSSSAALVAASALEPAVAAMGNGAPVDINFTVVAMNGAAIPVTIPNNMTIFDLKHYIHDRHPNLSVNSQRIMFRPQYMGPIPNHVKLSALNIDDLGQSELDLMLDPGMGEIVSIEDNVKYPGRYEMKDPPCRLWTFKLENGEIFKVYRTNRAKGGGRYITYIVPRKDDDITGKSRIYNNIYDVLGYSGSTFGVTAKDGFLIERTLKTHETPQNMDLNVGDPLILVKHEDILGGYLIHLPVYCECGRIVDLVKMKAHYKTRKHQTGDEEGRQFMERARAYVSEWKPFQELQKHFSQIGGAKRHFTIQSMIRDDIEVDIDAKLTVGDLKRCSGITRCS